MSEVPLYTKYFPAAANSTGFCVRQLAVGPAVQGYLAHKKHPPVGPYSSPSLGTYGDPRGVGVSYERGAPVHLAIAHILFARLIALTKRHAFKDLAQWLQFRLGGEWQNVHVPQVQPPCV